MSVEVQNVTPGRAVSAARPTLTSMQIENQLADLGLYLKREGGSFFITRRGKEVFASRTIEGLNGFYQGVMSKGAVVAAALNPIVNDVYISIEPITYKTQTLFGFNLHGVGERANPKKALYFVPVLFVTLDIPPFKTFAQALEAGREYLERNYA